jgi:secreted PhoX family phosphatase
LRGGLATFAAAMMSKLLPGCDGSSMADAGPFDAGPFEFPMRTVPAPPTLRSLIANIGPLGAADANGVRVPAGFTARILATSGEDVPGTTYEWHDFPDGGRTFITEDGGYIYVSNSEVPVNGGVSAIRFTADGEIMDAYRILHRTNVNCSGGHTPWHTWLSAEEVIDGRVWECDPWGESGQIARPAMGIFKHEAVAFDPVNNHFYLSEDETDGLFYRFVPDRMTASGIPDLTSGRLEAAVVATEGTVTWVEVPDPQFTGGTPTRQQVSTATIFDGGEGLWWHNGIVYLSTKGDDRIWAYDVAAATISVLYDSSLFAEPVLSGVDAITVTCCGDVLVAEDGGSMDVVAITPAGDLKQLVQIEGHAASEVTGIAFSPDGTRLYFNSQRGAGTGISYEVTGPFHEPA